MKQAIPPRKKFGSNLRPIDTRESEPTVQQDKYLRIAKEAFDTSTTFVDSNYSKDWQDSIRHFQNKHMAGSKYYSDAYKYRSKMFRPKTRAAVRQNEAAVAASFFSQLEIMAHEPEDDNDPFQLAGAALRQELINYRLGRIGQIPWFQVCVGAMQEANVYGVVTSKQFWDYEEKKERIPLDGVMNEDGSQAYAEQVVKVKDRPDIKLIPIENVRFDPAAEWTDVVKTSPYFIHMDPVRIGDVRKKINRGEWLPVDESVLLSARNASYDSTRQARSGEREDETDPRFSKELSDFDIVWVHENFIREDGEEKHYYTLGTLARLTEVRPLTEVYLHNERPFVVGTCVIEPHKAIPDAPVHLAKGLQKEANEISNSRQDNVKLVLNKRYLVRRGKQVDTQSLVRNAPASVTFVNDIEKDVFPLEFSDVTASAYAEQDRVNLDMDELLGSFSQGSIQSNRKLNETVGGMQLLAGSSNNMSQYLIRVFSETWAEKVINQIDKLEQYYESDINLLNLMASRAGIAKYGIQQVTKDLLMVPSHVRINVANSAMDPGLRLGMFMEAMKAYTEIRMNMPPDLDPEPIKAYIFGMLGFRNADRFSVDTEGNPQLAQAQQIIEQLQQQLESGIAEAQAKAQAANEAKFAEIEANNQRKAAELQQKETESQRNAELQVYLAEMQRNTELLINNVREQSKADTAQQKMTMDAWAKELTANLNHIAQMASVQQKDRAAQISVVDSQASGPLKDLSENVTEVLKGNEQTANAIIQLSEAMGKFMQQLSKPVDFNIERDSNGRMVSVHAQ